MAKLIYSEQPNHIQTRISQSKSEKYFTEFTDHHRLVVLRSTHQSLSLVKEDKPFNFDNEVNPVIASLNAVSTRFHCAEVLKDSCIISESFASKLLAYKETVQKFSLPSHYEIYWDIAESNNVDDDLKWWFYKPMEKASDGTISKHLKVNKDNLPEVLAIYLRKEESKKESYVPCFVRKNQIIARIKEPVSMFIRTSIKVRSSVVISITEEENLDNKSKTYTIVYKSLVPVQIGDKLMNQTGHKFTVSKIVPQQEMPSLENGTNVDILIPYEIVKRNTPSTILEEICSIYVNKFGEDKFFELFPNGFSQYSAKQIANVVQQHLDFNNLKYVIPTTWKGKTFDAPYGYIRIFRCDNIPEEICKWTNLTSVNRRFNEEKSVRISYNLASTLFVRGANNLVSWIRNMVLQKKDVIETHNLLVWCLTGVDFSEVSKKKRMVLWRYLPQSTYNQNEGTILGEYINTNPELYEGSVLDNVLSKDDVVGYVKTFSPTGKEVNIFLPPFLSETFSLPTGSVTVSSIAQLINLLIYKTDRYKAIDGEPKKECLKDIHTIIVEYQKLLHKLLVESVYDINSPRLGSSIYATGIGNSDLKPNQVSIPKSVYEKFVKSNKMFAKKPMGIAFRQPIHNNCEVNSVEIVPGPENVIGFNPITVSLLYGDFDGDTYYVFIPTEKAAYEDMEKIKIQDTLSNSDYYKVPRFFKLIRKLYDIENYDNLAEYEMDNELAHHQEFLGLSTFPGNFINEELTEEFNQMWESIIDNSTDMEKGRDAAWDMGQIKVQTSNAGSMSLAFMGWVLFKKCQTDITNEQRQRFLRLAQDFYKFSAQNALKSKTGSGNITPWLWEEYLKAKVDKEGSCILPNKSVIKNLVEQLVISLDSHLENYDDLVDLFWEFLTFKSGYESTQDLNSGISPIFSMIRRAGNVSDIKKYVDIVGSLEIKIPYILSMFNVVK